MSTEWSIFLSTESKFSSAGELGAMRVSVVDDPDGVVSGLGEVGVDGEALAVKKEAAVVDTKLCL